jgi:hypothetical protein
MALAGYLPKGIWKWFMCQSISGWDWLNMANYMYSVIQ